MSIKKKGFLLTLLSMGLAGISAIVSYIKGKNDDKIVEELIEQKVNEKIGGSKQ